jgi:hypothetical protein
MNKDRNLLREIWNEIQTNHALNEAMPVSLIEKIHTTVTKQKKDPHQILIGGPPREKREKLSRPSCFNEFCRINKDGFCAAYEYMELLCPAEDFSEQCDCRIKFGEHYKKLMDLLN